MKLLSKIYTIFPVGYITIYSSLDDIYIEEIRMGLNRVGLGRFKTEIVSQYDSDAAVTIVAKRFNIGNLGKDSVVILKGGNPQLRGIDYFAFHKFASTLLNIASFDSEPEIVINSLDPELPAPCPAPSSSEHNFDIDTSKNEVFEERHFPFINKFCKRSGYNNKSSAQEIAPSRSKKKGFRGLFNLSKASLSSKFQESDDEEDDNDLATEAIEATNQEDNSAVDAIELDKKMYLDRISAVVLDYVTRFNEVPPIEQLEELLQGKLTIASNNISPIVVNRDLKVILSAYNELEMRFSPLLRTIYILFLCHPEGIVLKQISDYRKEIDNIYLLIKPGGDDDRMKLSIDDLCDPCSDSLRQKLSKINHIVKSSILNPKLSESYCIHGQRGLPYRIDIDANLITLPQCLR